VVEIVSTAGAVKVKPGGGEGGGIKLGSRATMHEAPAGKPLHEKVMESNPKPWPKPRPLTEKGKLAFWPAITVAVLLAGSVVK
jgi:hypothetical protein